MPNGPANPGEACLKKLAAVASKEAGVQVSLASQTDSSFAWKSAGIHPLQPLENVHQRVVREAEAKEDDPDERRKVAQEALSKFFPFDTAAPELLGPVNGEVFTEEVLREAKKKLTAVLSEARAELAEDSDEVDADKLEYLAGQLDAVYDDLDELLDEFADIVEEMQLAMSDVPLLEEIEDVLDGWQQEDGTIDDWEGLKDRAGALMPAATYLNRALTGLACVQIFFVIDTFYLYRLLVRYRVESDDELTAAHKSDASSTLTGTLNNESAWLIDWLKAKLRDIDQALQADVEGVHFHLKGGRALEYLKRTPQHAVNDWDTSILIDPHLSAQDFYAKLTAVHDLVLKKLRRFKMEFFVLMHKHAAEFSTFLDGPPPAPNEAAVDEDLDLGAEVAHVEDLPVEDEAVLPSTYRFLKNQSGCKAELIDIGIPRRDTVEAFEHWHRTAPGIIRKPWTDDVPIPRHLYYIEEYVMMVRDAFSSPMAKAVKRIVRLYSILDLDERVDTDAEVNMKAAIQEIRQHVDGPVFPKSLPVADGLAEPLKRLVLLLLQQFMHAYGLTWRPGLARVFDTYFEAESARVGALAYPPHLQQEVAKARTKKETDPNKFLDKHDPMLKWLGFADEVAKHFEQHFRDRAAFLGFGDNPDEAQKQRKKDLGAFVKALYTASVFSQKDELEVQFAVTGSFAAYLYADYARPRLPADLKEALKKELDPVTTVEVKLFCHPAMGADPNTVLEALIVPGIVTYTESPDNPAYTMHAGRGRVHVHWPEEAQIGAFTYRPLVARLSVVADYWPQLAFIWGYPVVSLRDLIREYDQKAAEAEEFTATQRLKKTSALLKAMLTHFET